MSRQVCGEGLFAKEVAELWEPWMQLVDELLQDQQLVDAVYEPQGKRHTHSRQLGRQQTLAEVACPAGPATMVGLAIIADKLINLGRQPAVQPV